MKLEEYDTLANEFDDVRTFSVKNLPVWGTRAQSALRDLIKRVREAEEMRDFYRAACDGDTRNLLDENAQLREALQEISMGAGEFSRDPLQHCTNCVEAMKATALAALSPSEADSEKEAGG